MTAQQSGEIVYNYLNALISEERIIELHSHAISEHGGLAGLRCSMCIPSTIEGAVTSTLYQYNPTEPEEAILPYVAYLIEKIVTFHCFSDGNKRVAWQTAVEVLAMVDLTFGCTQDDATAFILDIVCHKRPHEEILEWIVSTGNLVGTLE